MAEDGLSIPIQLLKEPPCDINADVYPWLLDENPDSVGAWLHEGWWFEAGGPARYLELNLELLSRTSAVTVVSAATIPAEPVAPRPWRTAVIALFVGLVVGIGAALGLGGRIGSGRQWMSWIHLDDAVQIVLKAIETESVRGPVNLCAPEAVTNAEFTRTLARTLHRPAFMHVPAVAGRLHAAHCCLHSDWQQTPSTQKRPAEHS